MAPSACPSSKRGHASARWIQTKAFYGLDCSCFTLADALVSYATGPRRPESDASNLTDKTYVTSCSCGRFYRARTLRLLPTSHTNSEPQRFLVSALYVRHQSHRGNNHTMAAAFSTTPPIVITAIATYAGSVSYRLATKTTSRQSNSVHSKLAAKAITHVRMERGLSDRLHRVNDASSMVAYALERISTALAVTLRLHPVEA